MIPEIILFADGSCPKPHFEGGYAYILRIVANGLEKCGSGGAKITTNNRMEISGILEGLKQLSRPCKIKIVSDSQYALRGLSEWLPAWKRKNFKTKNKSTNLYEDMPNADLWKEMWELLEGHEVTVEWVRGHAGHLENEKCDALAGLETKKMIEQTKNVKNAQS